MAQSPNQVPKRHGRASVCAFKIHISLTTEDVDSGRLGPALCFKSHVKILNSERCSESGSPRLPEYTSVCAGRAVQTEGC